ncbi:hypothetical protein G5714_010424 [Onychostoma macrolepis]|uniref:Uncharacterized protein n=1 Tax=Onychostoma macrolepis TaxID=369639 RepID=A0A7J6CQG6_9TELE|nr:hypothetical protein G5714_010424 [Onychostoma macrolepis]
MNSSSEKEDVKMISDCDKHTITACVQFIYLLSEIQEIVGQGGDNAGQLLVVQAGCQASTCVTVSLFLSLPLQIVGCFGLKDVQRQSPTTSYFTPFTQVPNGCCTRTAGHTYF